MRMSEHIPPAQGERYTLKASQVDWGKTVQHEKTGVYMSEDQVNFEFHGYLNDEKYVVVGEIPRIVSQVEYERWCRECSQYMVNMSYAH